MANSYSTIGVQVHSDAEFVELARRAATEGEALVTARGAYGRLTDTSGAELWVQVVDGDLVGLAPHFAGDTAFRLRVAERIQRGTDSPLDGAFYAFAPLDDEAGLEDDLGTFPVVFDIPDGGAHDDLVLPAVIDVQLAAFAHGAEFHRDDDAYRASQGDEMTFAVESFIPSGTFVEGDNPPSAMAILTGRVLDTRELTNGWSGATFRWARVRTLGGELDVVADPEIVTGEATVGGVVQGEFWISGRLPPSQDR
jgi:hypothetical protein